VAAVKITYEELPGVFSIEDSELGALSATDPAAGNATKVIWRGDDPKHHAPNTFKTFLMQSGDEANAEGVLQVAAKLDPFNRRAANQLKLVQQLLGYATVRTEHFIVKYKPGIDQVLERAQKSGDNDLTARVLLRRGRSQLRQLFENEFREVR